jgi:CBS domain-containing protein
MAELEKDNVIFVDINDDLQTILSCFKHNQISHVPVTSDQKLVGMISKTDVVEYLYDQHQEKAGLSFEDFLKNTQAKELMMQPLIEAKTADTQMMILEKLLTHEVSSVVIRNEDNKVAGIVTDKDMLRYLTKDKEENMSFSEKLSLHLAQWLENHGIIRVSKALSDIGI